MTSINVRLTAKELDLLGSLVADQLFQREFIDTRLPGHKSNLAELSLGRHLIERLRILTAKAQGLPPPRKLGTPGLGKDIAV